MKTGLVLEGGGMRGLFTAGVLDVMMERDIKVDGIVGVSAGACFGCNYLSKQPGRILRYNINMINEPRYMSLRNFLRTGNLMDGEFAYHTLPDEIDIFDRETYAQSDVEYHIVCTDVLTGEPVYKRLTPPADYEFLEWLRASSSLPLVSKPVEVGGRLMLDGKFYNYKNFIPTAKVTVRAKGEDLRETIYISASGSEDNDGLTPDTPKKEITNIATYLKQGYNVKLKRGDTWYLPLGSITITEAYGTEDAPLSVGAYGSGNKPIVAYMQKIEELMYSCL